MGITDGIKLGIGIIIGNAASKLIICTFKEVKNYVLETDFDDDSMNKIKKYLKKEEEEEKKD